MMDSRAWLQESDQYLDELEAIVELLSSQLVHLNEQSMQRNSRAQHDAAEQLGVTLQRLQGKLDQRRELLHAYQSLDSRRLSLRECFRSLGEGDRLRRADFLSARIDEVRRDSLALFVVQFQLFETSKLVLRAVMAPDTDPGGYGKPATYQGGSLFDDAA